MEFKVILNVSLVLEVEFFRVEGDVLTVLGSVSEFLFLLQKLFEVLACEGSDFFRLGTYHFLNEVLENAREFIGHINLLGSENTHFLNVRHLFNFNYIQKQ
jgi:hypothetical protein